MEYAKSDALLVNGELKDLARWPNNEDGWNGDYYTTMTLNDATDCAENGTLLIFADPDTAEVVCDPADWSIATFVGIWDRPYNVSFQTPITTDIPEGYEGAFYCPSKEFYSNPRAYVLNSISELDAPGEYYVDYLTQTLYYYPEAVGNETIYFMNGDSNAIEIDGADHLVFENLKLVANGGTAIKISNADDITIYNATITGVGSYGIDANATNLLIAASNISQSQANGIRVQGGDKYSLTPSNNEVRNTRIHDYSIFYRAARPGAYLDGVGVNFHHNEVYNSPHKGIEFQGNDHIIANNRVYDVMMESFDSGAIYTMRSWIGRGTQIVDNYIYMNRSNLDFATVTDELKYGSGTDNEAIYIDDMASGITVDGNIIYNISRGGLMGGGSDNTFTNNIMIDTRRAFAYDNAGEGGWRVQHINSNEQYSGAVAKEFVDFRSEDGNYSNKDAWNKYDGFAETMAWIDVFDAAVAGLDVDSDEYDAALAKLGRVRNRTVENNVVVGDWVRLWDEWGTDSDGNAVDNHWQHTTFISISGAYEKDGVTADTQSAYVGDDAMFPESYQYNTKAAAGVTITDHEIEIDPTMVPEGVSTSTSAMGVMEDEYIPTVDGDEFDVNSSYRFDVIAAIYDGDNKLQQTSIFNKAYIKDGQTIDVDVEIPADATSDWYVKLMLWDKLVGMKPIATQSIVLD